MLVPAGAPSAALAASALDHIQAAMWKPVRASLERTAPLGGSAVRRRAVGVRQRSGRSYGASAIVRPRTVRRGPWRTVSVLVRAARPESVGRPITLTVRPNRRGLRAARVLRVRRPLASSLRRLSVRWRSTGKGAAVVRVSQLRARRGDRFEIVVPARGRSIAIRPASARLRPGGSRRFSAARPAPGDRVIWSVDGVPGGGKGLGSISPTGVYTAPPGLARVDSVRIGARVRSTNRAATAWVLLDGSSRQRLGARSPIAPGCPRRVGGGLTLLECPIEKRNQTMLEFGQRSHWIQPWRAYLDTVPASRLRDAIGIQFNVPPDEAEATAQLLAASGVRRARVEIGWGEIDYDHPDRLWRPERHRTILNALVRNGIRPLILLNAHHGVPAPRRVIRLTTVAPARAGDRVIELDPASAGLVVPGRTGFDARDAYRAAETIIAAVDASGRAQLSRPLAYDLPAGTHPASLLRHEPFSDPTLADGSPNPRFEDTMAGWISYVDVVTGEARRAVGGDAFDVEVWNELTFGSDFLDIDRYYEPDIDGGAGVARPSARSSSAPWRGSATRPMGCPAWASATDSPTSGRGRRAPPRRPG